MEKFENKINQEITPKDISHEFEIMDELEFARFLRTVRDKQELSIITDFNNINTVRKLKAFVDVPSPNQRRFAIVKATREQYEQDVNAFQSGVKWEEVN